MGEKKHERYPSGLAFGLKLKVNCLHGQIEYLLLHSNYKSFVCLFLCRNIVI